MRSLFFLYAFFAVTLGAAADSLDEESCPNAVATSVTLEDARISISGFTEADLNNPAVRTHIDAQRVQASLFLKFLDENEPANSTVPHPKRVEIRPHQWRSPGRIIADFLAGAPHRMQQYPDTQTLVIRMPRTVMGSTYALSADKLVDCFYGGLHLERVDRIALRARRRLNSLASLKQRRLSEIRTELSQAAKDASEKIAGALAKIKMDGLASASARLNVGGLVQAELNLTASDAALIEGWDTDVVLKVLESAKTHLDSGNITDELLAAVESEADRFASNARNSWDWRISIAPLIIRSQDIGQIHTWGDNASRATDFVEGPTNRTWFFHLNIGWLVVDTLDDYDIRVYNQITVHKGAELTLAVSRAIAEMRA